MLFENISDLTLTGFSLLDTPFSELETPDDVLAAGGFGKVYEVYAIDDEMPDHPLVIKQFTGPVDQQKKGYKTVVALQERVSAYLKKHHANPDDFFRAYPGLLALPLCSFQATVDGEAVFAYCSLDLNDAGFVDLEKLGEGDTIAETLRLTYQAKRPEARLLTGYRFVSALAFLKDELRFQHADIKAESVWLNLETDVAALIDFDGGVAYTLANLLASPTTFGTPFQDWLAPELVDEIDDDSVNRALKISWESDYWAAGVGLYYLLDLHHPYQFLPDLSKNTYEDYFSRFTWPDPNYPEEKEFVRYQIGFVNKLHGSLAALFRRTFGTGYDKKGDRAGFYAYQLALKEVLKESYVPILNARFDREYVLQGEPVSLSWKVENADHLQIDGQAAALTGQREFRFQQDPKIWLTARNEFRSEKICVEIEVVPLPVITFFNTDALMVKEGQRVTLRWQTQHAKRIQLYFEERIIDVSSATEYTLDLRRTMTFRLVAHAARDLTAVEETRDIRVIPPVYIDHFSVDPQRLIQTKPVTISWRVRNATSIRLEPNTEGKEIPANGRVTDYPNQNPQTYRLIARNELYEEQRDVVVSVFLVQVPEIKLPVPPRLPTFGGSPAMPRSGQIRQSTQQIQQRVDAELDELIMLATKPEPKPPGRWYKKFLDTIRA